MQKHGASPCVLSVCQDFLFKQNVVLSNRVTERWRADGQRGVEWIGDNRVWQLNYSWRPWSQQKENKTDRQYSTMVVGGGDGEAESIWVESQKADPWKERKTHGDRERERETEKMRGWKENAISYTRREMFFFKKRRKQLLSWDTTRMQRKVRWDGMLKEKVQKSKQKKENGRKNLGFVNSCTCLYTQRHFKHSSVCRQWKKKERTCGICEPEGDRLVFDVAHIADGHLTRVISKVFGSEVLELQHLGLTLWDKTHTGLHHAKRQIFYVANMNDAHKH